MSTANLIRIMPPTEGFLAIVRECESEVRQAVNKQTKSEPIMHLNLPNVCDQVEGEYSKIAAQYSIEELAYKPLIFLLNGGPYIVPAGFGIAFIPLVILDTPAARATLPQSDPVQLQAGSMVIYIAAEGKACLEMRGGGKVVCAFFLFKAKGDSGAVPENKDSMK